MTARRIDILLVCATWFWLIMIWAAVTLGWGHLTRLIIPMAGTAFATIGILYVRLATLRRRVAELEAAAGKNPPPTAQPAKDDEHQRKLHISRLE
jgi:hypothetical protein